MSFYNENTSGWEVDKYYWFDLRSGWEIGKIVKWETFSNGIAVLFCGSDEPHLLPFCYIELIEEPED